MGDYVERSIPSHYSVESTLHAIRAARERHPNLSDLLALHEDILALQALAEETGESAAGPLPRPEGRSRDLAEGIPWLHFDDLALGETTFAHAVRQVAAVLRQHRQEWVGEEVSEDPAALLMLARTAVEGRRSLIGDQTSLAEASVEMAIEAEMRRLAGRVAPHLELDLWRRGSCPFCGSPPALSLLEPSVGARFLFCQRCHTSWSFPRTGCAFCPNDTSLTYHTTDNDAYRLYVCPICQKYLKTIDLRKSAGEVNPAVEHLLTVGLDLAAVERGYLHEA
jgi:formate dehydrogenase maturation protein FdhE